mmetsp:Transcript_9930/g.25466  ORF Transcript_9930/g.25466 Transcript_9930/m.25466 type:complete len:485 (-) Transcript_9930:281-1735(-)
MHFLAPELVHVPDATLALLLRPLQLLSADLFLGFFLGLLLPGQKRHAALFGSLLGSLGLGVSLGFLGGLCFCRLGSLLLEESLLPQPPLLLLEGLLVGGDDVLLDLHVHLHLKGPLLLNLGLGPVDRLLPNPLLFGHLGFHLLPFGQLVAFAFGEDSVPFHLLKGHPLPVLPSLLLALTLEGLLGFTAAGLFLGLLAPPLLLLAVLFASEGGHLGSFAVTALLLKPGLLLLELLLLGHPPPAFVGALGGALGRFALAGCLAPLLGLLQEDLERGGLGLDLLTPPRLGFSDGDPSLLGGNLDVDYGLLHLGELGLVVGHSLLQRQPTLVVLQPDLAIFLGGLESLLCLEFDALHLLFLLEDLKVALAFVEVDPGLLGRGRLGHPHPVHFHFLLEQFSRGLLLLAHAGVLDLGGLLLGQLGVNQRPGGLQLGPLGPFLPRLRFRLEHGVVSPQVRLLCGVEHPKVGCDESVPPDHLPGDRFFPEIL